MLTSLASWNTFEPMAKPLMKAIESIRRLKYFHVKLLHDESCAHPILPDPQHRAGQSNKQRRSVISEAIYWRDTLFPSMSCEARKQMQESRCKKADGLCMPSSAGAPLNTLMETSDHVLAYWKIRLEGYDKNHISFHRQTLGNRRPTLEFLELKGSGLSIPVMDEITQRHKPIQLKTCNVLGNSVYPNDNNAMCRFPNSFDGLEELRCTHSLLTLALFAPYTCTVSFMEP